MIKLKTLICIPGNAGTEKIAHNIKANTSDFESLYKILKSNNSLNPKSNIMEIILYLHYPR